MPARLSSRIVAALICGASTAWAQPVSSATRRRFAGPPWRAKVPGPFGRDARRANARRQRQHRRELARRSWECARRRAPAAGRSCASSSAARNRLREGRMRESSGAQQPVGERALVGRLDVGAGMIDEMHVVHARRAGRHAGEAGQAAVDMLDHFGRRRTVVLQHVLDEIDAPARLIEFVAEQQIGRAGRRAEAAMDAGADDSSRTPACADRRAASGEKLVCMTPQFAGRAETPWPG